jgi:hypothetical protein
MGDHITYQELIEFYGHSGAYSLLRVIENSVREKTNIIYLDKNKRFQHALEAMREELLAA